MRPNPAHNPLRRRLETRLHQASRAPRTAEDAQSRLSRHGVVPAKVRPPRLSSFRRERIDTLMSRAWGHRLVLVVAPAGSGKTTLLTRFAESAGVPVAWYRAEPWDSRVPDLLAHLEGAFAAVLPEIPREWRTIQDAARALEACSVERLVLVVDDLHALADSRAELALERLVTYAPSSLTIVAASRAMPRFNLSRMRVSGDLMEIGADDLRFRSWEVERLFREFYGDHVPPEELAVLARRTNGWAAGLQLFHLATRNRTAEERRGILATLGPASRLTREYLARNVLDHLSPTLRAFLVETSPLGRLTGALCDAFLGRDGSHEVLVHLERNQIFTSGQDDGSYRYHEVLQSHLEGVLLDQLGESGVRDRYAAAAALLESAGALPDALAAYCRAEQPDAVHRLLGRDGERLVQASGSWLDIVPPALMLNDGWVMLATARRHRDSGRWSEAVELYERAEAAFAGADASVVALRERLALNVWLDASPARHATDWSSILRQASLRDPAAARARADDLDEPWRTLTAGLASLLAGQVTDARRLLRRAVEMEGAGRAGAATARVGAALAALLSGEEAIDDELHAALAAAEAARVDWLSQLARAIQVFTALPPDAELPDRETSPSLAGEWRSAIEDLIAGWALLRTGRPSTEALERAARSFRTLNSAVLEVWALALLSLSLAIERASGAREAAVQAENMARSAGVPAVRTFCYLALAELEPARSDDYLALAAAATADSGLVPPWHGRDRGFAPGADADTARSASVTAVAAREPVMLQCLGGLSVRIGDRPVDLAAIKPRARALLRVLAVHLGAPVHREVMQELLWPDVDAETGRRNLHVAISAVRQALEPGIPRGSSAYVRREGDAYRLALPLGSEVDVVRFERAIAAGRAARADGDVRAALSAYKTALDLYRGDLLPEDGPAEWVVAPRERYRDGLVEAAIATAELALAEGDHATAIEACGAGLRCERFHDPLWRLLIEARERAGDSAAANVARNGYSRMLAELGVTRASEGDGLPAPTPE